MRSRAARAAWAACSTAPATRCRGGSTGRASGEGVSCSGADKEAPCVLRSTLRRASSAPDRPNRRAWESTGGGVLNAARSPDEAAVLLFSRAAARDPRRRCFPLAAPHPPAVASVAAAASSPALHAAARPTARRLPPPTAALVPAVVIR